VLFEEIRVKGNLHKAERAPLSKEQNPASPYYAQSLAETHLGASNMK
jgi:hypothetical protein